MNTLAESRAVQEAAGAGTVGAAWLDQLPKELRQSLARTANQYLSHEDRNVRDLAVVVTQVLDDEIE